jgi:hypothetical protein
MGREFKTNIIKEAMKIFNEIIEKKIFFDFRKNPGLTWNREVKRRTSYTGQSQGFPLQSVHGRWILVKMGY